VVISKIDTRYPSEDDARARMPREFLRWLMKQIKDHVMGNRSVGEIAVFPVSGYGFGTAEVRAQAVRDRTAPNREALIPHRTDSGLSQGEKEWTLKPGALPRPFNLTPLVVWSLLSGMRYREIEVNGDQEPVLARVIRKLHSDLDTLNGWTVSLKNE
jgi:hypothetical protein